MTTYLVIVTISIQQLLFGNWSYKSHPEVDYIEMKNLDECEAIRHQKEFLPPPKVNTAQIYFCVEK